ncbi:MAG: hydroxymethylglutaryl-CoA reductase [Bacteriovoracaceae bacterium]|nr:hydroxymethylglutaryl-CoA reductase [Bacteriovoracaceae bacterium]
MTFQQNIESVNTFGPINGFSKLSKNERIALVSNRYINGSSKDDTVKLLKSYWHRDEGVQKILDQFSENTITNFYSPYGVVPNLLVNDRLYCVPMVTEESSVVSAAAKSTKYWLARGGVRSKVISTAKIGQIHFLWQGSSQILFNFFESIKEQLLASIHPIIQNMEKRGGGVKQINLVDRTHDEQDYYQIVVTFDTCDAMGANFINSVLEKLAHEFSLKIKLSSTLQGPSKDITIIMSILSNYAPNCLVRSSVECDIDKLDEAKLGLAPEVFAQKLVMATKIAQIDVGRAVTHNKGIFNGIDAVVLATGNDFRAVEACGHAYAARDGKYKGLSLAQIRGRKLRFSLEIPLAIGTVGGLTSIHPMAEMSLEMLGKPNSTRLMEIIAALGLMQNFAALRSLVTSGIQKGHMKMHLINILNHLNANELERAKVQEYFQDKVISYTSVREYLETL